MTDGESLPELEGDPYHDPFTKLAALTRDIIWQDLEQGTMYDPTDKNDIKSLRKKILTVGSLDAGDTTEQLNSEIEVQIALANIALRSQTPPEKL